MRFGKIYTGFWTSPDIADLSIETKTVGLYLLSSPHANMIGCYRLPIAYVVEDLKMGSGTLVKGFESLSAKGFMTYDSALSWVLIRKFLKWNPIENPNQGKAAAKLVQEVPKGSSVYEPLIEMLKANSTSFPEGFIDGLETVPEGYRNQEPYPYKEPYPQQGNLPSPSAQSASGDANDGEHVSDDRKHEISIIERLFNFYCEGVGRDPRHYTLTNQRREKALLRLRERRKVHGNLDVAEADLAKAIENLAASEYHRTNGYLDWLDQIFRSAEEFEKRLAWKRPAKGVVHADTSSEQNLSLAQLRAIARAESGGSEIVV